MSSPIERLASMNGLGPFAGHVARRRRIGRRRWAAPACAALLAAVGCSAREDLIATITREAGQEEPCVPSPREATDMGLDLYFVMDHSRDMQPPQEWGHLASALSGLFGSAWPEFAGMGAGFAVYPKHPQTCSDACPASPSCNCLDRCDCWDSRMDPVTGLCTCLQWGTSCSDVDYGPSLDFVISRATENPDFSSTLFKTIFDPVSFNSDEPAMHPALLASLRTRNDWEARHPGRRITQVLVAKSLNFANWCMEESVSDVEKVLGGDNKPKTYVVAVNADPRDVDEFDRLATAGRTYPSTQISYRAQKNPITPIPDTTNALAEIVRKIRRNDGRCEYLVPAAGPNRDYNKVNLRASSGGQLYKKVANRAACASDNQGWYYDSDEDLRVNPDQRRIVACDGACKSLHGLQDQDADPAPGTAKIELGCPTIFAGDAGP